METRLCDIGGCGQGLDGGESGPCFLHANRAEREIMDADGGEESLARARRAYERAVNQLEAELTARIGILVRQSFPMADEMDVEGEHTDDGCFIVRAQCLRDSEGAFVAGWHMLDGSKTRTHWDDLTDEVDPLLDWLGDLDPDGYLGLQTVVVSE